MALPATSAPNRFDRSAVSAGARSASVAPGSTPPRRPQTCRTGRRAPAAVRRPSPDEPRQGRHRRRARRPRQRRRQAACSVRRQARRPRLDPATPPLQRSSPPPPLPRPAPRAARTGVSAAAATTGAGTACSASGSSSSACSSWTDARTRSRWASRCCSSASTFDLASSRVCSSCWSSRQHALLSLLVGLAGFCLGLGASPRAGLARFAEESVRLVLGRRERARGLLLGVLDRCVGRALSEHEGALEGLVGLAGLAGPALRISGPSLGALGPLPTPRGPVRSAGRRRQRASRGTRRHLWCRIRLACLAELDLMEELGRDVHVPRC